MNNQTSKTTSGSGGNQASGQHNGNRVLRLGLDLHYRQVTVAMQEDGGRIKSVGKMSHQAFGHWVDKKLAEGWQIESCYEAGASGYWLHRLLVALGVKNLVVAPKAMGQAKGWRALNAEPRLKDWMKEQLEAWRKKLLSAEEEQRELRRRIEALAPALRPKGVGAYSTAVLEYEMKGWERFHNRGAGEQLYGFMSRDPPERWPRQGGFDQSLWQPGGALELGGNGLAADGLATPLWAGASVGGWLSAK